MIVLYLKAGILSTSLINPYHCNINAVLERCSLDAFYYSRRPLKQQIEQLLLLDLYAQQTSCLLNKYLYYSSSNK